jgi:hypothetical protein
MAIIKWQEGNPFPDRRFRGAKIKKGLLPLLRGSKSLRN